MQSIINSIIKYRNLIIYLLLLFFSFNNLYNKSGLHFLKIGNISISIAGFSANIIDASYIAIHDSITFKLYHDQASKL